jgi:outer membrane protein TolC
VTNLDLAAADRFVAAGEDQVRESRAPLLPQVGLGGDVTFRDPDTAELLPIFGKREYNANLSFRQQIYSENDWAAYSIEKSLLDRKMNERAQIRLDVILEAAQSYLEVLRTKSIERIQKENLQLTRENLALARSRVEIGIAGREELFRWEDEIATNQRTVVEYEALRRQAELALNRVLNHPLDEKFLTIEAALNDPELVASFEALTPFIESPRAFQLFNAFMVNEAFTASPEIRQLEALLRAKERERDAAKRSFFLPEFFLQGGFSWFDRVRAGDLDLNLPELNKTWEISVNANLPLFQGAGRWARVSRTNNEIQELTLRQDATRQRVEQRIRSILQRTNASFIGIDLANASAAAAEKNLELVSDSYAQGVIGILALLDAQNRALVAKQAAANAIFTYLIDLMGVQRAVGQFDYYRSPQERQEFLSRLRQFYQENGFNIRTP